jgi:N-acetylneuraminic acid mutarotase
MEKITHLLLVCLFVSTFMVLSEYTALSQQATENAWKALKPMPDTIPDMTVALNGQIHVIGHTKHYIYDPAKDQWTTKQPMPATRSHFGIAIYQDKIYTIGGAYRKANTWIDIDVVEVYDPQTDTWETKTLMPTARSNLHANEVDGKIYLTGGSQNGYPLG